MSKKINLYNCSVSTFFKRNGGLYQKNVETAEYKICESTDKNCYSYAQSHQVMRYIKTSDVRTSNKIMLRNYKCKKCGYWHLTSEKEFKENRELPYIA